MRKTVASLSVLIIIALSLMVVVGPFIRIAPVSEASQSPLNAMNTSMNSPSTSSNSNSTSREAIFSDPHVTSTVINQNTQFSLKWSDPSGIVGYIFSYNSGSGQFVNSSYVQVSNLTTVSTSATKTIPGTMGERVQWMFFVKDSVGIWSKSYTYSFVAGASPSDISIPNAALVTDNAYDLLAYDGTYLVNLGNFPQLVATSGSAVGFNLVKWNPQGTTAIAVGYNNSAILYSRATGGVTVLSTGASMDTNLVGLVWAPNGTTAIITGSNPDVILTYSSVTGQFTQVSNPTGVSGLGPIAWNSASGYALIAGSNGLIKYSTEGTLSATPSAAGISFSAISFNANGTMAIVGTSSGSIYKYSSASSGITLMAKLSGITRLHQVAFSRDGHYALITAQSQSSSGLFKFTGNSVYRIGGAGTDTANQIAFAPDDSYAYITTDLGDILTENYNQNSTSLSAAIQSTSLGGIDFLPPPSTTTTKSTSSTAVSSVGFISIQSSVESYSVGKPVNLSGYILTRAGGTALPTQTVFIWIDGQNLGSATSNSNGYWTFSFMPTSNRTYYAIASQNPDGSGVASNQIALVAQSGSTTSSSSSSATTTTNTTSASTSTSSISRTTISSLSNSSTSSNTSTSSTTDRTTASSTQDFAALFEFVPYLTSSTHTPLATTIFTLEVIIIVAIPFVLARVAKKEKEEGKGGSRKWRW